MLKDITVDHVLHYKEATGWFVLRTDQDEVVVGTSILQPIGSLTVEGEWTKHRDFGKQFKARKVIYKGTLEVIEALLASGFLTGIKQSKAQAMIQGLGVRCFEVLDACLEQPPVLFEWNGQMRAPSEILLSVKGIGPVVANQILEAWKARRGIMTTAILGVRSGMSARQFRSALIYFGEDELEEKILHDPYGLSVVDGFTWEDVDLIAGLEWEGKSKIPHDSPARLGAALREALNRQRQHGHLAYPLNDAIYEARVLAGYENLWDAVKEHLEELEIISFGRMVATKSNYEMEVRIANDLSRLMEPSKDKLGIVGGKELNIQDFSDLELAPEQIEAVHMALSSPVCMITGGPGTGKTTTLNTILNILDQFGKTYVLCAPTGKAAVRMTEATGREAYTIHRFFELIHDMEDRPRLAAHYLFVDEFSMVSADLLDEFLPLIPNGHRVVLVGDHNQLPPVGPGEPLTQLLNTDVPRTNLEFIFRQAETSGIVLAAHDIVQGITPQPQQDFMLVEKNQDRSQLTDFQIVGKVISALKFMQNMGIPGNEIQVLTPLNGGAAGRKVLNNALHEYFNPTIKPIMGLDFKLGSRVIHLVNNYKLDVMNGEVGYVVKADVIDKGEYFALPDERQNEWDEENTPVLWVQYPNHKNPVGYSREDLKQLTLAYALTVHKSQGSEYPAVICVFTHTRESFMLRQLAYTAVTRAKKLCAVISTQGAFAKFIANATRVRRFSCLADLLNQKEAV